MKPDVFTGPLLSDVISWGVGAQLLGGVLGYVSAEGYDRLSEEGGSTDVVWIATRAAFAAATFAIMVVVSGHLIRTLT